jgi:hypothetical protein
MILTQSGKLVTTFTIILFCFLGCSKKDVPSTPPPQQDELPQPYTENFDSIMANSVEAYGGLFLNGGHNVTEVGFCWSSTDSLPTLSNNHAQAKLSGGDFWTKLTGLTEKTTYHVRAYAKNIAGLAYGNVDTVTTVSLKPVVKINSILYLSSDFANIDCELISQGNSPIIAAGVCWSTTDTKPTIKDDTAMSDISIYTGTFTPFMMDLTVNTKYYVRAYATNSDGTGYSDTIIVIPAYWIGQPFQGGKIFYVDDTHIHGLIAAPTDFSNSYTWLNMPYVEWTFAQSWDNGLANTNQIILVQGSGNYAAIACTHYYGGGYTDWFLPSISQLYELYQAKDKVGEFQTGNYWSSTETSNSFYSAYVVSMGAYSHEITWDSKETFNYVRAIRAF